MNLTFISTAARGISPEHFFKNALNMISTNNTNLKNKRTKTRNKHHPLNMPMAYTEDINGLNIITNKSKAISVDRNHSYQGI